jgi:hypothetical protein
MRPMVLEIKNTAILEAFEVSVKAGVLTINDRLEVLQSYSRKLDSTPENLLTILQSKFFPGSLSVLSSFLREDSRYKDAYDFETFIKEHFFYRGLLITNNRSKSIFHFADKPSVLFNDALSQYLYNLLISGVFLKSQFDFLIDVILKAVKNERDALANCLNHLQFENNEWFLSCEALLQGCVLHDAFKTNSSVFLDKVPTKVTMFELLNEVVDDVSIGNDYMTLSNKLLAKYQIEIEQNQALAQEFKSSVADCGLSMASQLNAVNPALTPGEILSYYDDVSVKKLFVKNKTFDQLLSK